MNLKYDLPKEITAKISLSVDESVWYSSPYDIGVYKEKFIYSSGYLVVTNKRMIVLDNKDTYYDIFLNECKKIRCEVMVDNGVLSINIGGVDCLIARFSMKYLTQISYIAGGAQLLADKDETIVVSKEVSKECKTCGRALPGTSICPSCDGKFLTLKRFWKLCGNHQAKLILISLFMVISSGINLLMPQIQKNFIDDVLLTGAGDYKDVLIFIGMMLGLTAALLTVNLTRNWWSATLGANISMELRDKLYEKVQTLSLTFMQKRKPGDLMNRVVRDTAHIRGFMEDIFSNMVSTLVTMVAAFIAMLFMDAKLTIASIVFMIFVVILNRVFRNKTMRMFRNQWRKEDKLNSSLQDVISGIRVVKSFGKEKDEAEEFRIQAADYAEMQKKNEVFFAYLYPIMTFIMGMGVYFATYFGGINVLEGRMTTGELIQFIAYTNILYGPLGWVSRLPRFIRQMIISLERIYDILDEEPDIKDTITAKDIDIRGKIEFKDVGFGYKIYEPILTDVNLLVEPGEMIGLVGASGSGKSTLINLLMRLYDVDHGQLLIDGTDITEIKTQSLHSQIGVVLQETFLFTGTLLNNIRFSKPGASLEEVILAAKAANAHDFIVKTPDGYNTYVGERGFTLSGGERQRIAITRAILNDPKLLILDEATSNLDTESEYLIGQALNRLKKGRTTFAIAHRLSTLKEADRLVVIDGQRIAELGSHNELIEQKGLYYRLVEAQLEMQKVED